MNAIKPIIHLIERYNHNIKTYVGYPQNIGFDYTELYPLLKYPINNFGDPFLFSNPISSHEFEQEVIRWFLRRYGLDSNDSGWGYVTNGGTEGNFFGLWLGRENLKKPIVYYAKSAHYSIPKIINILDLEGCAIETNGKGEISPPHFEQALKNKDALVLATLGSTMTSSIDNVTSLKNILNEKNIKHYIHADAAFDGMILPFCETEYKYKLTDGIDSVAISGHKLIGAPMPCGVVLTKQKKRQLFNEKISYINNSDCTIAGSRSGFAAAVLWHAIKQKNVSGFTQFVQQCQHRANYYTTLLNQAGIHAWKFDHAITIVLDKLDPVFTKKWRAPSDEKFTTLTALPKLTEPMLNELIDDILHFRKTGNLAKPGELMFPEITDDVVLSDC